MTYPSFSHHCLNHTFDRHTDTKLKYPTSQLITAIISAQMVSQKKKYLRQQAIARADKIREDQARQLAEKTESKSATSEFFVIKLRICRD